MCTGTNMGTSNVILNYWLLRKSLLIWRDFESFAANCWLRSTCWCDPFTNTEW